MLHVLVPRDISERRQAEAKVRELNSTLERRIGERTAELAATEARLRTLLEHAPEAIVVFDGATGRFLSGNAHVCRLYGRTAEELTRLRPADVSPEFQADGRRSSEVAGEKMAEALAGGAPVFEWIHRHASGRLIPTEVRLVRLPAEGSSTHPRQHHRQYRPQTARGHPASHFRDLRSGPHRRRPADLLCASPRHRELPHARAQLLPGFV